MTYARKYVTNRGWLRSNANPFQSSPRTPDSIAVTFCCLPLNSRFPPLLRFLRLCLLLRLQSLFAVAPDHHDAEETAHDGAAEEQEDYGDADGPDSGWEEALDGVVAVDEGLSWW